MRKKAITEITIVAIIVGFMLAVQYNTIQKPTATRDTRDILEIRQELSEEKKRHSQILFDIEELKNIIRLYEDPNSKNKGKPLKETLNSLRKEVGLTDITGPGVKLTIRPATELLQFGYSIKQVPPDLLNSLINEIYKYNGKYLEIDGKRIVHTTAIRNINGQTTINSIPIQNQNIEIRIITDTYEEAEKLYSYLYSSTIPDAFYIDNFILDIHKAEKEMTISAYDGNFEVFRLKRGLYNVVTFARLSFRLDFRFVNKY